MNDPTERAEDHLAPVAERFLEAMEARRAGDVDGAAELLLGILRIEPRLAEPHLELAAILLDTDQLDEAEEHAREAVRILDAGGQWIEDLPENVVGSLAHGLLGEILRRIADTDEVVFGDADRFTALMDEARAELAEAARLDPSNEHAAGWTEDLELPPGTKGPLDEA